MSGGFIGAPPARRKASVDGGDGRSSCGTLPATSSSSSSAAGSEVSCGRPLLARALSPPPPAKRARSSESPARPASAHSRSSASSSAASAVALAETPMLLAEDDCASDDGSGDGHVAHLVSLVAESRLQDSPVEWMRRVDRAVSAIETNAAAPSVCALLQCLARSALFVQRDAPLLTRLVHALHIDVKSGKRWDAAALIETAFLLAKLGHDDPDILNAAVQQARAPGVLAKFTPQALAHLAYALASAEHASDVLARVASASLASMAAFDAEPLSSLAWALVTGAGAGENASLFEAMANRASALDFETFRTAELVGLVWAFAQHRVQREQLLDKVARHWLAHGFAMFTPQQLSVACWSFAALGLGSRHTALFKKMSMACVKGDFAGFAPRDVALVVWAFASCDLQQERFLYERASAHCLRLGLDAFGAHELVVLATGFAELGVAMDAPFFAHVFDACARRGAGAFTPKELATLAWAVAASRVPHVGLVEHIGARFASTSLVALDAAALSDAAWGLAAASTGASPAVAGALAAIVCECQRRGWAALSARDTVTVLWSLACAQQLCAPYALDALNRFEAVSAASALEAPHDAMSAQMVAEVLAQWRADMGADMHAPPLLRCIDADHWVRPHPTPPSPSALAVLAAAEAHARSLGCACRRDVASADGVVAADVHVTTPSGVAFILDVVGSRKLACGTAAFRRRLLERAAPVREVDEKTWPADAGRQRAAVAELVGLA